MRVNRVINNAIIPSISGNTLTWAIPSISAGVRAEVSFQTSINPLPAGIYQRTFRNTASVNVRSTNTVTLSILEQEDTLE